MADKTGIEWTNATWNPIAGCNDVSAGCTNCYARGMAHRLELMGSEKYTGLTVLQGSHVVWTGKISFDEDMLLQPLRWKRPRRIFVNSMSDLFHENVTDEMRDKIFAVMALCPQHTFQVLTKRPERMKQYFERLQSVADQWAAKINKPFSSSDVLNLRWMHWRMNQGPAFPYGPWPLPNVWLGVSVENQKAADERIPLLLKTPAVVRFLSCEPLLGSVVLKGERIGCLPDSRIDWVIAGGESGPKARPMHPEWARSLRDQCAAADVPFFFKQHGEYVSVSEVAGPGEHYHFEDGATVRRVGKKAAGHLLDGVEHHAFPVALVHKSV